MKFPKLDISYEEIHSPQSPNQEIPENFSKSQQVVPVEVLTASQDVCKLLLYWVETRSGSYSSVANKWGRDEDATY